MLQIVIDQIPEIYEPPPPRPGMPAPPPQQIKNGIFGGGATIDDVKMKTCSMQAPLHRIPANMPGFKNFVSKCIQKNKEGRPRSHQALNDPWFTGEPSVTLSEPEAPEPNVVYVTQQQAPQFSSPRRGMVTSMSGVSFVTPRPGPEVPEGFVTPFLTQQQAQPFTSPRKVLVTSMSSPGLATTPTSSRAASPFVRQSTPVRQAQPPMGSFLQFTPPPPVRAPTMLSRENGFASPFMGAPTMLSRESGYVSPFRGSGNVSPFAGGSPFFPLKPVIA